jgi:uncharacterized membrane protein
MRTFSAVALNWLHQIALSLWLGGIAVIGIVAAPAVFGTARAQGQTATSQPLYRFAGEAMGEVFRRFNYVVLIAGVLLLVTGLAYGTLAGLCKRRLMVRAVLTLLALGVAAWVTFGLYPELVRVRSGGEMGAFDQLHHTYSMAFQVQLLLLVTVAALTGWMHLDRDADGAAAPIAEPLSTQRAASH